MSNVIIISDKKIWRSKIFDFAELTEVQRSIFNRLGKRMILVRGRYLQHRFERIFDCLKFGRNKNFNEEMSKTKLPNDSSVKARHSEMESFVKIFMKMSLVHD